MNHNKAQENSAPGMEQMPERAVLLLYVMEAELMERRITNEMVEDYRVYLYEQEKSRATIEKYTRDLDKLAQYAAGRKVDKSLMIAYKEYLKNGRDYKTSSVNSFLVAANRFFDFMKWYELKVKTYRVQKEIFMLESRELSKEEYKKLVKTAMQTGKNRVAMIVQTICATGIRVSELSFITVSAVKCGVAVIYNKGKERQILIPRDLQVRLLCYIRKNNIKSGAVFQTSGGKAVDRTWVWREMKKLCEEAGVEKDKVFPHNLRHLFARKFYGLYRDIVKLADVLGHNSIETTRIYLKESCVEYRKQLERLNLLVDMEST